MRRRLQQMPRLQPQSIKVWKNPLMFGIITSRNNSQIKDLDYFGEHCIIPAHTCAFAEMV